MAGGKIFISYRRADSQWAAARLYDHLAQAFPNDNLFMDVEKIAPGQDFVDVLADQVGACDVFLALIGPQWLELTNDAGDRRIDDPADFVRIEIASALTREGTLTIPVLLDGAKVPAAEDLPGDLAPLARRQFSKLTHEGFRQEVGPLTEAIAGALVPRKPAAAPRRRPPWRWIGRGVAALSALALAGGAAWFLSRPPDPSGFDDLAGFKECERCPEMIILPAGKFLLGSPETEEHRSSGEGPQVEVTLPRFAIGRTELRMEDYNHCVDDGACAPLPGQRPPKPDAPATTVRLVDAQAYIAWLNDQVAGEPYRVPSEAEWEYAARAGTTTPYFWGETWDRAYANLGREVCCIGHAEGPDKWKHEAPVASFKPNPWGLYDMSGNLAEWTADSYDSGHADNPANGAPYIFISDTRWGRRHVIKGGSYSDRPWNARSAYRNSNDKEWRLHEYGFRPARALDGR